MARMRPIAIRFDDATLRLLDDFAERERAATPGRRCSRSDAVRTLVARGMRAGGQSEETGWWVLQSDADANAMLDRVSASSAEREERENATPPEWARRAQAGERFRAPSAEELESISVDAERKSVVDHAIDHASMAARALCRLCLEERERQAAK